MRYDIPQTEYVRIHTVSQRGVRCKRANTSGFGKMTAKPGDFLVFRHGHPEADQQHGRVLGRIESPYDAKGFLSVAVLSPWLDHVMIRWVDPLEVERVTDNPAKLMAWFFRTTLPTPEMVVRLSCYGTLSERYIHNVEHHITAWEAGMSPATYDALYRGESR